MSHRINIPSHALAVCTRLKGAGLKAYLVGGCVRDSIMGVDPNDWDVATDASPEEVTALFDDRRVVPTGIKHGTVTVIVDGQKVEVTTFRSDGEYTDGRRPDEVTFVSTIEADLSRRDFTCNAIAYDPTDVTFIDPFSGREHIEEQRIVAVGDPRARFEEDALRMMRAVRFACTKDFSIDRDTFLAMITCSHLVQKVSKERIRDELMKVLCSPVPDEGVEMMAGSGLLDHVCPELLKGKGMHQNDYHAYDVWEHVMSCLEECVDPDPLVRLAVFLHDIAKPATQRPHPKKPGQFQFLGHEDMGAGMAEAWMVEMKFSRDEVDCVKHLVRHHLVFYESGWNDAQVRKWVQRVGKESVSRVISVARADLLGKGLDVSDRLALMDDLQARAMRLGPQVVRPGRDLAISGHDVMKMMGTLQGGPKVGECLRALSEAVMEDPELNNRDALLRLTVAWASSNFNPCAEVTS